MAKINFKILMAKINLKLFFAQSQHGRSLVLYPQKCTIIQLELNF